MLCLIIQSNHQQRQQHKHQKPSSLTLQQHSHAQLRQPCFCGSSFRRLTANLLHHRPGQRSFKYSVSRGHLLKPCLACWEPQTASVSHHMHHAGHCSAHRRGGWCCSACRAARGGFILQSRRPEKPCGIGTCLATFIIGPAAACMHRAAMIAHNVYQRRPHTLLSIRQQSRHPQRASRGLKGNFLHAHQSC